MQYIFIINGRDDKSSIRPEIEKQLAGMDFHYEIYMTAGIGDATRYVNLICDLYPKIEHCFIACGGFGNGEHGSCAEGVAGVNADGVDVFDEADGDHVAFGITNDFVKCFPGRDFNSIRALLKGTMTKIDALKVNESYAINVINIGMDAMVAYFGEIYHAAGYKDGFKRALARAVLGHRINRVRVEADGRVLSRKYIMQATLGNGKICGGEYLCAPRAILDDGLMEVCVFKTMPLLTLLRILPKYRNGQHLDDAFSMRHLRYMRAKHVELSSDGLIYLSLDGETIISNHFNIDVLDKAVNLILPAEL